MKRRFLQGLALSILVLFGAPSAAQEPESRAFLGVATHFNSKNATSDGATKGGFVVDRVEPGSPAEAAGLKAGDVIHAIDHSKLYARLFDGESGLNTLLARKPPGRQVTLHIIREGAKIAVTVTPVTEKEGCELTRRQAETGAAESMYQLALCYAIGRGLKQDFNLAEDWLKRAAAAGSPSAKKMSKGDLRRFTAPDRAARARPALRTAVTEQITTCWKREAGQFSRDEKIKIRFVLGRDGTLKEKPVPRPLDGMGHMPLERKKQMFVAAVRAVGNCAPFNLPPEAFAVSGPATSLPIEWQLEGSKER
jgi:hypothetical protein